MLIPGRAYTQTFHITYVYIPSASPTHRTVPFVLYLYVYAMHAVLMYRSPIPTRATPLHYTYLPTTSSTLDFV